MFYHNPKLFQQLIEKADYRNESARTRMNKVAEVMWSALEEKGKDESGLCSLRCWSPRGNFSAVPKDILF